MARALRHWRRPAIRREEALTQQINLFNPLFLKQQRYFSAITMLQAVFIVGLAMASFYGYQYLQLAKLERQIADSDQAFQKQKIQLTTVMAALPQTQALAALDQQAKDIQTTIASRQSLLQVLTTVEAGKSSGYAMYLAAFARQVVEGVWLTSVHIGENGNDLAISGRATNADLVPVMIRKFRAEPVLKGRQFESLEFQSVSVPVQGLPSGRTAQPIVEFRLSSNARQIDMNAGVSPVARTAGTEPPIPAAQAGLPAAVSERLSNGPAPQRGEGARRE